MFVGACLIFSSAGIRAIQTLVTIVPIMIFLSAGLICIPLLRASFSITVSNDGIRGPRGIIPFKSSELSCHWQQIQVVEFECLFSTFVFYKIRNARGDLLLCLPGGCEHYNQFKKILKMVAPPSSPILIILKFDEPALTRIVPRVISGMIKIQTSSPYQKILPNLVIELLIGGFCVSSVKTNEKGNFFFETKIPEGECTLRVADKGFKGLQALNVNRAYHGDLVVSVSFSRFIDG